MQKVGVALVGVLVTGVAVAGTYGDVTKTFKGYSASISCSVGYMKDHARESTMYAEKKAAAEKELTRRRDQIAAAVKHFVDDKHPFRQHLDWLARDRTEPDYDKVVRTELSFGSDGDGDELVVGSKPIVIGLYTKESLSDAQRQRLAMDFAGSTIFDGVFTKRKPTSPADPADTQQVLLGLGGMFLTAPATAMRLIAERRPDIVMLAGLSTPLPKKYAWQGDQRPALIAARAIVAYLAQQPFAESIYAELKSVPPAQLDDLVQLIAMLSPNAAALNHLRETLPASSAQRSFVDALLAI